MKNPKKLIEEIKKENRFKYTNPSILNLQIPMKDNKCILEYMTSRISEKTTIEKEKKIKFYLIKIIDDYIKEKCLENKYNIEFEKTDHNIKALKNFKNLLKINLNKGEINGKIYKFPHKNFDTNYKITKKVILKNGYRNAHYVPENVNFDIYKKLYSVPGVGSEDNIFKPKNLYKLYNKNGEISKDNNNYLKTDSDFNKTYNTFSYNQKNLSNRKNVKFNLNDNNNTQSSNLNTNNEISLGNTQSNFYNVTKNNFRSTTTTGFNITKSNLKQTENNNNTNTENNLSFLSNDSFDENINYKLKFASRRKKFYTTFSDIKNISEYENKMLKGFQIPEIEDQRIFLKNLRPKLKTPGEIYLKDIELLKKVNPLAFKKEEEKEIFDRKVFEKKKKNKQIYERVLHNKK